MKSVYLNVINQRKGSFYLDKTYLDFTDDAGNCFILYSATLRIFFFKINYAALIYSDFSNQVTEQSIHNIADIEFAKEALLFSNSKLGIKGSWKKTAPAVEALLYSNNSGIVNWNCHHPLSQCDVRYKGRNFQGLGYAETIFLSIKPWELPIDELKWGRFLAPRTTITWIQWIGQNPINKIYFNGKEWNDAVYSAEAILFNEGKCRISFFNVSILRRVKFAEHLAKIPLLKLLLNKALLNSLEIKYKSGAIFTDDSGNNYQGRSIFEIVTWEH
jgi:hypothetical protein